MSAKKSPRFKVIPGVSGGFILSGNNAFLEKLISVIEQAERCDTIGTVEHALAESLREVKVTNRKEAEVEAQRKAKKNAKKIAKGSLPRPQAAPVRTHAAYGEGK